MRGWLTCACAALIALMPAAAGAQSAARPIEFPVKINGGKPGAVVELFLNNGKKAEVVLDTMGLGDLVLNMGNSSKTKLALYADVCKDGQMVRVMFTEGEPPPKDDDCNRRLLVAGFYNNCGVTYVTIDPGRMFGKVNGCGFSLTSRTGLSTIGGGLIGLVTLTQVGGGGSPTATSSSPPSQTPPVSAPPVTSTPPSTTAPPSTTPPVSTTPPSTTPPVTTTPPATSPPTTTTPSTPSAAGSYACTACSPSNDPARHDPTLRWCAAIIALFTVTDTPFTIRTSAGNVELTGSSVNTSTGAFDITGRGSIGPFSNVTVRAVGTVDFTNRRITVQFTWGNNGEFPGGQPITYSVTLQLQ